MNLIKFIGSNKTGHWEILISKSDNNFTNQ